MKLLEFLVYEVANNVWGQFLGASLAILVAGPVRGYINQYRFGGWKVNVIDANGRTHIIPIGVKKSEEIQDDESTLRVFLKGLASPFGWINLDLLSQEAKEIGLFVQDSKARAYIIDLRKNPPKPEES